MRLNTMASVTVGDRTLIAVGMLAACLSLVTGGQAVAQTASGGEQRGVYASRGALEAQAVAAEQRATDPSAPASAREANRAEAWRFRYRLEEGDFALGDRIVVAVVGEPALTDTFTVRAGPSLVLGELPAITLRGVLRSELHDHLTAELGRFLRQPQVSVVPLLRVTVLGQIGRPGFHHVPADMLLSDVLMTAGGPAGNADLERSQIRRGDERLYAPRDFRIALADGLSLDALGLRSGDELRVAERRRTNWLQVLQVASVLTGFVTLAIRLTS